ncbi:hypothetical protein OXX79_005661 [Metschnikowia pulcherrima]
MRLVSTLFTLVLALADFGDVEVGLLLLNAPLSDTFMQLLRVNVRGELSTNGRRAILRPGSDGVYKEMTRQRYLNIDENGKVVFTQTRQPGFSLSYPTQQLLYKGEAGFVLCGDDSVGYQCDCENKIPVFIIYRELPAGMLFEELKPPDKEWYVERLCPGKGG